MSGNEILIDGAGWGDLILGVVIGALKLPDHEYMERRIPSSSFQPQRSVQAGEGQFLRGGSGEESLDPLTFKIMLRVGRLLHYLKTRQTDIQSLNYSDLFEEP